ncbi:MAG: response regulator [Devosia sp.]|jgi:two-component system OmpR family response regulator|uniref:response regulator n=1 Tax=Devosia sp. TaxID=1871048 RepID=UPI0037C0473E
MAAAPHILVVDDDQEIRKLLARYLSEQGFRVSVAGSRREFNERIATEKLDLVILDVLLPDGSGLDLCRQLRQKQPQLPVILVTALKEDVDRIIGLEIGADDYIGKPFNPRELLARVRAVLRRVGATNAVPPAGKAVFRFAGLKADAIARSVVDAEGRSIELTGAEFDLLRVFLDRPGRVLSRDQLLDLTQGREAGPFDRSIDVLMSRLRKKLGAATQDAVLFKTVRNGGYQLAVPVEREDG